MTRTNALMANQKKLYNGMSTIHRRILQCLDGDVCRMPDEKLLKKVMLGMAQGCRRPVQPTWRWTDNILIWCNRDIKVAIIIEKRDNWRFVVPIWFIIATAAGASSSGCPCRS